MDPDTNYQLPLWITNVKAAIRDPDVKIHVTLDGLTGSKHCADDTAKAYDALREAVRHGKGMSPEDAMLRDGTNWELAQLINSIISGPAGGGRDRKSVHFYCEASDISAEMWDTLPTTDTGWRDFKGI